VAIAVGDAADPSSTRSRVTSETVRTVPSRCAVSGMTLRVVPAVILPMVMTRIEDVHAARDERLERLHDLARDGMGRGSREAPRRGRPCRAP